MRSEGGHDKELYTAASQRISTQQRDDSEHENQGRNHCHSMRVRELAPSFNPIAQLDICTAIRLNALGFLVCIIVTVETKLVRWLRCWP